MSRSPGAAPERQAPAAGERRSAVRGVAWTGVESAAGALVGFLLTPLVVRVAGIEGLGLWGACWSEIPRCFQCRLASAIFSVIALSPSARSRSRRMQK